MSGYWGYQHARISARNPRSLGRCQRCGRTKNRYALAPQYYWEGTQLENTNIYVCIDSCLDVPNEQLRAIVLPPDPVPIYMPQQEDYFNEINSFISTEDGNPLATESLDYLITETGNPNQHLLTTQDDSQLVSQDGDAFATQIETPFLDALESK